MTFQKIVEQISKYLLQVLIILLVSFSLSSKSFSSSPQFEFGDEVSVFSDKAFRKNGGDYFEAVGNVVIVTKKDTLYGESASFDKKKMIFKVEGNVRLVSENMTLYGSELTFNSSTGYAEITNARIITPQFNLIARFLRRLDPENFQAIEAEFSTCKDCKESWSIFGKEMNVQLKNQIVIRHGLAKIKNVSVLYLPYVVFPIQSKRKTGLLFPKISSRMAEGLAFEQPIFWAINESSDMTLSPTFWAKRGYGGDVEYREKFGYGKWLQLNTRLLDDTLYWPGEFNSGPSGKNFFRYFTEVEHHWQQSSNLVSHMRFTGARDLDIIRDHPQYTDLKTLSSDMGFSGFIDWRQDLFSLGVEADYSRNQLFNDPVGFDRRYVQTMPRVSVSSAPMKVYQHQGNFLNQAFVGVDSSFTRFAQVMPDDSVYYRNADRVTANPYAQASLINIGPVASKVSWIGDYQRYRFTETDDSDFEKNASLIKTEFSFSMDRVFGISFEEKVKVSDLSSEERALLEKKQSKSIKPITESSKNSSLIGKVPVFEDSLTKDYIYRAKNSYRHSQEFKFIHHYLTSKAHSGNQRFYNQIQNNQGWFDYLDAERDKEFLLGGNITRMGIPPTNTLELQWNNILIKKSPKQFSYLQDDRYLRDNFNYRKIGYFDVSQGYLFDEDLTGSQLRDRLTRLMLKGGYITQKWSILSSEYFFHQKSNHIFQTGYQRNFDFLNLLASYNYNSFPQSRLHVLALGGQVRPTDAVHFSMMKEMDLYGHKQVRTVYAMDLLPNNNCWIFNLNYRESVVDKRYSFNILFNFGDRNFARYKTQYFSWNRF